MPVVESILEHISDCFYVLDNDWRFVQLNQRTVEYFQSSRNQLLGKLYWDLLPKARSTVLEREYRRAVEQGVSVQFETPSVFKQGVWLSVRAFPVPDGLAVFFTDITEQKKADAQRIENERRYRETLEGAQFIALMLDTEGKVSFINDYFLMLTGYRKDEVIGQNWFTKFLQPGSASKVQALFSEMVADAVMVHRYENYIVTKSGDSRYISWSNIFIRDAEGKVAGTSSLGLDMTEKKLADKKLRESEERFRQFADNVDDAFFIRDLHPPRLLYCNPAFERMIGGPAESFFQGGKLNLEIVVAEDRDRVKKSIDDSNSGTWDEEFRVARAEQGLRWLWVRTFPLLTPEGTLFRIVGIVKDVTQRRQMEEQLQQAQKMEAVGLLAGGIAHDFNNMLTVINGQADLVLAQLPASNPVRDAIRDIRTAGDRAASVTRQLLAFSRRQFLMPVLLDINQLLTDLKRMLDRLLGKMVDVRMWLQPRLGFVRVDRHQFEQVFLNLILNARDAMPSGGVIEISSQSRTLDAPWKLDGGDLAVGSYVCCEVSDTGEGMSAETLRRVFEPFFTTKEVGKGTGLGLAVVYGIVRQSGGHIEVRSKLGKGSTFTIWLPCQAAQPVQIEEETARPTPRGAESLLVIEEEDGVRLLTRRILERQGYTVLAVRDAKSAMETLREKKGEIALLLTDILLPKINGSEVADLARKIQPGIKILFVSGYVGEELERLQIPHDHLVRKPFSPATLAERVRKILDLPA